MIKSEFTNSIPKVGYSAFAQLEFATAPLSNADRAEVDIIIDCNGESGTYSININRTSS